MKVAADNLIWYGRNFDYQDVRYFSFSSSGFCFVMKGKKASAKILSDPQNCDKTTKGVIGVFVSEGNDTSWNSLPEEPTYRYSLENTENDCILFESEEEQIVTIRVIKFSEAPFGYAGLKSLEIEGNLNPDFLKDYQNNNQLKVEIIGDSITCGYGIEGVFNKDSFTTQQERADKSYAFLTAKLLNAKLQCCSWSGIGLVSKYVDENTINPDTVITMPLLWPYTDRQTQLKLGLEPSVWDESRFSPDLVIVHLGTNDASWVKKVEERRLLYVSALRTFIEAIHRRSPKAKILCALGVMGQDLCDSVEQAIGEVKKDFPKLSLKAVKFPVQSDDDGIAADWHPSAKTHKKIAEQLTKELEKFMN